MKGKLIALESGDSGQLLRAAEDLANQLRAEGHKVEIKAFPQRAHSAAYFVNRYEQGAYEQANPYVTSLFYALDRFESKTEIEELLKSDVTVICAGYLGTTLATLGAQFTDKQVRKGYYMWAYSLETGTFTIAKPDISVVISEAVASFTELSELFPADFKLETNPEKLRSAIGQVLPAPKTSTKQTIVPADPANNKTETTPSTVALLRVIKELAYDGSPALAVKPDQHIMPKKLPVVQASEFQKSLAVLNDKRKKILAQVHKKDRATMEFLLLPLATKTEISSLHQLPTPKPTVLQHLLDEYVPLSYGEASQTSLVGITSNLQNELALLGTVLAETTGATEAEAEKVRQQVPYGIKSKMIEAYVSDVKNGQTFGGALKTVSYNCRLRLNLAEILTLKRMLPTAAIEITAISPRYGYKLPEDLQQYESTVEPYFDTALDCYTKLSNSPAAELLVTVAHVFDVYIIFDAKAALQFTDFHDSDIIAAIKKQLQELHPILFTALLK